MPTKKHTTRSKSRRAAKPKPAGAGSGHRTPGAPAPIGRAPADNAPLLVAGVGASAGGLEALSQVLQAPPGDPGLAMVLVQHLAPQHQSALTVLLSGRTHLRVIQATEGM